LSDHSPFYNQNPLFPGKLEVISDTGTPSVHCLREEIHTNPWPMAGSVMSPEQVMAEIEKITKKNKKKYVF